MTFAELKRSARAQQLDAIDCGNGHWQIKGPLVTVNYYPTARRGPKAYVNGAVNGFGVLDVQGLFLIARGTSDTRNLASDREKRKTNTAWRTRMRHALHKKQTGHCYWHHGLVPFGPQWTIDHIIPLSRGGSNRDDNLVGACQPCNSERANGIAAPAGKGHA